MGLLSETSETDSLMNTSNEVLDFFSDGNDESAVDTNVGHGREFYTLDEAFTACNDMGFYQQRHLILLSSAWFFGAMQIIPMSFFDRPGVLPQNTPSDAASCVDKFSNVILYGITKEWGLICDDAWKVGFVSMMFFFGWMFGVLLFGSLADIFGRKKCLFVGLCINVVAGIISAIINSYWGYVCLRWLCGFCAGGWQMLSYVLCVEFFTPRYTNLVCSFFSIIFCLGAIVISFIAISVDSWRTLTLICNFPLVAGMLMYPLCPESPRWLLIQGRTSEVLSLMHKIGGCNGRSLPSNMMLKEPIYSGETIKNKSLLKKFLNQVIVIPLVVMSFIWFTTSFVYYGLILAVGDLNGNIYFNSIILSLVEGAGYLLSFLVVDHLGRRRTLFFSMLLASAGCIGVMVITNEKASSYLAFVGKFGISMCFAVIYIFSTELFPTELRSAAIGICSMFARIGGIVAPFTVGLASTNPHLPMIVWGIFAFSSAIFTMILPETLGRPISDTVAAMKERKLKRDTSSFFMRWCRWRNKSAAEVRRDSFVHISDDEDDDSN